MAKPRGWKLPMVSAQMTATKVCECAEVIESEVEVELECAGCTVTTTAWGHTRTEAYQRLREVVKGWGVIFDREVNDGEYPYCPKCIKSIFPNLKARLRAEAMGKPLPPRPIAVSDEFVEGLKRKRP